jgi:uncharacterized membrane protein YhaH (DUF805 family)
MKWYFEVWKKYAQFDGRASRMEYWMFVLVNFLVSAVLGFFEGLVFDSGFGYLGTNFGLIQSLYVLAVFIPSLAVSVRRLHDSGRSGWWLLLVLLPCIGGLVVLVLMLLDSEPGTNVYGPNPKGAV